jgi:hypothetical protein
MNTPSRSSLSSASTSDVAGKKYPGDWEPETVVREIRDTPYAPDVSKKGLADNIVI